MAICQFPTWTERTTEYQLNQLILGVYKAMLVHGFFYISHWDLYSVGTMVVVYSLVPMGVGIFCSANSEEEN